MNPNPRPVAYLTFLITFESYYTARPWPIAYPVDICLDENAFRQMQRLGQITPMLGSKAGTAASQCFCHLGICLRMSALFSIKAGNLEDLRLSSSLHLKHLNPQTECTCFPAAASKAGSGQVACGVSENLYFHYIIYIYSII